MGLHSRKTPQTVTLSQKQNHADVDTYFPKWKCTTKIESLLPDPVSSSFTFKTMKDNNTAE